MKRNLFLSIILAIGTLVAHGGVYAKPLTVSVLNTTNSTIRVTFKEQAEGIGVLGFKDIAPWSEGTAVLATVPEDWGVGVSLRSTDEKHKNVSTGVNYRPKETPACARFVADESFHPGKIAFQYIATYYGDCSQPDAQIQEYIEQSKERYEGYKGMSSNYMGQLLPRKTSYKKSSS